jgi:hypothetical protein
MLNVPPALRALPLPVADLLVAGLLYELLWPAGGLLLAAIGVLVLGSIVYRLSLDAGRYTARRAAR